jgi:AcrR family transcriptional regulator
VAKRAGVSVGLTYHHFGSKAGLVAGVVNRFYEPLRAIAFGDVTPSNAIPSNAIPSNISASPIGWRKREFARLRAMTDYFYDHPLSPLIAGRLAREPEVLDIERKHREALLVLSARNIAQGQSEGVAAQGLHPQVAATLLMGGQRLAIERAVLSDPRPERDRLVGHIWAFTCNALRLEDARSPAQRNQD